MSAAPGRPVAFGSSQQRTVFPLQSGSDRLGCGMPRQDAPHVGPGCYDNHEYGTMVYNLEQTPQSKKGYALSARTAARFPAAAKAGTPSPQQYQQDQTRSTLPSPSKTPFNSTTQRFSCSQRTAEGSPGPGTYDQDEATSRKVSWPMCFGRPDWTRMPQAEKKSLRVKLTGEKEFIKQRNRVAYLSLYY